MAKCPHSAQTLPIWEAVEASDLIVFAYPTYVFSAPGQLKALLDHFGCHWMAHRPQEAMFGKQALILTQAVGAGFKGSVKVVRDSLAFWGVPKVRVVKAHLMESDYALVSQKVKDKRDLDMSRAIDGILKDHGHIRLGLKTRAIFFAMGMAQRMIAKSQAEKGQPETYDHKYWQEKGWLGSKRPWKKASR